MKTPVMINETDYQDESDTTVLGSFSPLKGHPMMGIKEIVALRPFSHRLDEDDGYVEDSRFSNQNRADKNVKNMRQHKPKSCNRFF
jgi:hypothetical protein